MLTDIYQSVFSGYDSKAIYPVPNKWEKGATYFEIKKVGKAILRMPFNQYIIKQKKIRKSECSLKGE